ncbi:FtsX-like permease family protein [Polyangium sp. 6x1]|uniref:FtsX-like permease family protein n=1 Tax=Polyangium sp. 6x1 TaxID=3042689 RepID=UPI00248301DD|nr:FtsX-like permease family protein [Polyangium sp. 6x1]MDI1450709.1 FtsX-like permease family protein [Polyangium sp. 6x1]
MGYPLEVALRYLGSKKRAFISVGTAFAILGVTLGVAALATVMSVTGGFQAQFREKVLGVNAHVLVLKYSTDFREYRSIMEQVAKVPGVSAVAPFSINPMMLTHGDATATGVLLKGVDPATSLGVGMPEGSPFVLDLPKQVKFGSLNGLRLPGAKPPERKSGGPDLPPVPILPDKRPLEQDAGADGGDGKQGLLRAIEDELREKAKAAKEPEKIEPSGGGIEEILAIEAGKLGGPDKGEADKPGSDKPADEKVAAAGDVADPKVADGAPVGSVEPEGGYASKLPDDDDVPKEIDPDLCADPAEVAKLPGIVVGVSLSKTLKLELGDCVTVTSPTIGYSYSGGSLKPPVAKRFRVIAQFEAGFDQYDSKLVYTDLYEAQAFYDQGDTVTGVEMKVDDIDQAKPIAKQISLNLASGLYHTMDWEELNHGLFTALLIQQILMSGVLALIIVVAAFTVVATLIMVVLDKTKEISVLKAMGATDGEILRIFLYQGGIIGLLGTTFGLVLGVAVCKGLFVYGFPLDPKVYFISELPVQVRPLEFIITGAIAIVICLVATIVPSLYAARLRPAEGFRAQ